ncbi:MAG: hypothetical protein AB2660_16560 [Candidatus Thiodiazotropha sp.]
MKAITLALILATLNCEAGTAVCKIEIQDIQTGAKQTIEQNFDLTGQPQRKHFNLLNSEYRCTLVFFGLGPVNTN